MIFFSKWVENKILPGVHIPSLGKGSAGRFCLGIPNLGFFIALLSFFCLAGSASAEVMTFEEEYIYQASEYDSKVSCRTLALEQAKRILLEKMGTYLKNYHGIVRPTAQTPEGGALSRKAGR